MKKTYISPNLVIAKLNTKSVFLNISVNTKEIDRSNAGLTRQDNAWDIWGNEGSEE